jgi:hypothetical protein
MSEHEKFAWLSLAIAALVWAFFAMRMTEAGIVADVGVRHMVWTYAATVVLMIAAHSIVAAVLAARRDGSPLKDERDAALAGHAWPRIDLASLPTLVFALISALFGSHVVKQAAVIWQYRA